MHCNIKQKSHYNKTLAYVCDFLLIFPYIPDQNVDFLIPNAYIFPWSALSGHTRRKDMKFSKLSSKRLILGDPGAVSGDGEKSKTGEKNFGRRKAYAPVKVNPIAPHPSICRALVGLYHHIGSNLSSQYVGDACVLSLLS